MLSKLQWTGFIVIGSIVTLLILRVLPPSDTLNQLQQQLDQLQSQIKTSLPFNQTIHHTAQQPIDPTTTTEIALLKQQLQDLQQQLLTAKDQPDDKDQAQQVNPVTLTLEEERLQEQQQTAETVAYLNQQLQNEPLEDQDWRNQIQEEMASKNAALGLNTAGSHLQNMSCQSKLCRVEATHADGAAEQLFLLSMSQLAMFENAEAFSQRIENTDGSIQTISFISRAGNRLPEAHRAQQDNI
jgi:hypothetical protein